MHVRMLVLQKGPHNHCMTNISTSEENGLEFWVENKPFCEEKGHTIIQVSKGKKGLDSTMKRAERKEKSDLSKIKKDLCRRSM